MQKQIEMSTQQPEALEIASIFESWVKAAGEHRSGARSRGAKELRRLHARVQELEVINQQLSEQYDTAADCVTQLKAELVKEAARTSELAVEPAHGQEDRRRGNVEGFQDRGRALR